MQEELRDAILVYCIGLALLFVLRPEPVFDKRDGSPREFGTGPGETLLNLQMAIGLLAIASYAYTHPRA